MTEATQGLCSRPGSKVKCDQAHLLSQRTIIRAVERPMEHTTGCGRTRYLEQVKLAVR